MLKIKCFYFNPFRECCIVASDGSGEAVIVDPGCCNETETEALTSYIGSEGLNVRKILLTHGHFDHIFGVSELSSRYDVPVLMNLADMPIIEHVEVLCKAFGVPVPDISFAHDSSESIGLQTDGTDSRTDRPVSPNAGGMQTQTVYTADIQDPGRTSPRTRTVSSGQMQKVVSGNRIVGIQDGDIIEWGTDRKWEVIETPGHTPGCVCFLDREARLLLSGDTLFAGSIGRTDHEGGDYDVLIRSIFEKLMPLDGDISVIPGHGPHTSIADESTRNPFLQPFNEPLPEEEKDPE